MTTYMTVSVALAAVAAAGLIYVRRNSAGDDLPRSVRATGMAAPFVFGGATFLFIVALLMETEVPTIPLDKWYGPGLLGAEIALVVVVGVRVVLFGLVSILSRWALRIPKEPPNSAGGEAIVWSALLIGFAFVGGLAMTLVHKADDWGLAIAISLAALCWAVVPLFESMVLPWLRYAKAPRLGPIDSATDTWLADLREQRGIPRFRIRVQTGTEANACAMRLIDGHMVVVGGGLLAGMSATEIRAVLAHEVAHVVNRDVPLRLLPMAAAGVVCMFPCYLYVSGPLFATDHVLGVIGGALAVGLCAYFFHMFIPGFFMRKMEFRADRLAVDLLGDAKPMVDALRRLAELNKQPLEMKSWSHPSLAARIAAIEAIGTVPPPGGLTPARLSGRRE